MKRAFALIAAFGVLTAASSAAGQYSYDPNNPDEQGDNTHIFGSVKDDSGKILLGATILVQHSFVLDTDETGRFTGYAPSQKNIKDMLIGCNKPGFAFVRMTKREGATNGKPWIEADCVLKKAS